MQNFLRNSDCKHTQRGFHKVARGMFLKELFTVSTPNQLSRIEPRDWLRNLLTKHPLLSSSRALNP